MLAATHSDDEKFMRMALELAVRGRGLTSPNPLVGAVIVDARGRVAGRGWHRKLGGAHAEVEALHDAAGGNLQKSSIYVTLEPCSTEGRTPACVQAILESAIGRVVMGTLDPNPHHSGRAIKLLKSAGVKVKRDVLREECTAINRGFNKWITSGMPWVLAKVAMSLDGRITRPAGESRWLTGQESREHVHFLRSGVDAILVGANTVREDDPELTVRLPGWTGRQPWRVVAAGKGALPTEARIFKDAQRSRTIIYRNSTLADILAMLGRREVVNVMIEGGSRVLGEAFAEELVDEAAFYYAPQICGASGKSMIERSLPASILVEPSETRTLGTDFLVKGPVKYKSSPRNER